MSIAEVVKGIHDVTIVAQNVAELRQFYAALGFPQVVDRPNELAVFLSPAALGQADLTWIKVQEGSDAPRRKSVPFSLPRRPSERKLPPKRRQQRRR